MMDGRRLFIISPLIFKQKEQLKRGIGKYYSKKIDVLNQTHKVIGGGGGGERKKDKTHHLSFCCRQIF